jgi:hypothetical protein
MAAIINVTSNFQFGGVVIGEYANLDFPELKTNKVETTPVGSHVRKYIPDTLVGIEEATFSVFVASGILNTLYTAMVAGTIATSVFTSPTDIMTIVSGWIMSVKKEAVDPTSPDSCKAAVVLGFSGTPTFV